MLRRLSGVLVVLLAVAVVPSLAIAQEDANQISGDGSCTVALPGCDGVSHTAVGGFGSGGSLHSVCMVCTSNGVPVNPTECHACSGDLNEIEKLAYANAVAAGRVGDIEGVLKFATQTSGRVVFNPARSSIQITAQCDRTAIVANLPLTSTAQLSLAMALPRIGGQKETRVGQ